LGSRLLGAPRWRNEDARSLQAPRAVQQLQQGTQACGRARTRVACITLLLLLLLPPPPPSSPRSLGVVRTLLHAHYFRHTHGVTTSTRGDARRWRKKESIESLRYYTVGRSGRSPFPSSSSSSSPPHPPPPPPPPPPLPRGNLLELSNIIRVQRAWIPSVELSIFRRSSLDC